LTAGRPSPGVFAVGDVRSDSVRRVASAVGDGAVVIRQVHAGHDPCVVRTHGVDVAVMSGLASEPQQVDEPELACGGRDRRCGFPCWVEIEVGVWIALEEPDEHLRDDPAAHCSQ
jgi:hypothetical protein